MCYKENPLNMAVLYLIARVCLCVCMMVRLTGTYLHIRGLQELADESSCFQGGRLIAYVEPSFELFLGSKARVPAVV